MGLQKKNSKKTQRLTHLWPKARSSFFSEWTVVTEWLRPRQWSPAILDYMKNVMSNISTCLA